MATVRTNLTNPDGATIIGESVKIQGTLSGDEDLHVLGRVDGRIELQRTLVVAQSGIVKAEVGIKDGKIVEGWNNFDFLSMYQQLGMTLS